MTIIELKCTAANKADIAKQVIDKGENTMLKFQNSQTMLGYYSDTVRGSVVYRPYEADCATCYSISEVASCCYYVSHKK